MSTSVFYTKNDTPVDEIEDGPAFDALVLDQAVENHVFDYLDATYPDMFDTSAMQYEVEQGGDTIIGIEYIGAGKPPAVQIAPFQKMIDGDMWEAYFTPLRFATRGGKRQQRRQKRRTYKKRKSSTRKHRRYSRRR